MTRVKDAEKILKRNKVLPETHIEQEYKVLLHSTYILSQIFHQQIINKTELN